MTRWDRKQSIEHSAQGGLSGASCMSVRQLSKGIMIFLKSPNQLRALQSVGGISGIVSDICGNSLLLTAKLIKITGLYLDYR